VFEIYSVVPDCEEILEGRRGAIGPAFVLARRRWREYKGEKNDIRIVVRWEGSVIADDPCDFTMRRLKHDWYDDPKSYTRELPFILRRICRNCGATQDRCQQQEWGRITGYRWYPPAGRCKPTKPPAAPLDGR
jgi:hypothetical protein